jgi:hypothetical protein
MLGFLGQLCVALAVLGGASAVLGYVWLALGFFTNKDNELDGFSLVGAVTVCCPLLPFFVFRLKRPQKEPLILLIAGVLVAAAGLTARDHLQPEPTKKGRAPAESALALRGAAAVPPPKLAPPAPPVPVKVPDMDGKPVDLSSIMGRARALAEQWQHDAALTGLDATQVSASVVHTEAGGKATITFGPSPFAQPPGAPSSFVVTYDQQGLKGAPSSARPGKPLTEPMCAPERLPALTGGTSASLRYALAANGAPAWLVSDPATPRAKPRSFDANTCQERRAR